MLTPFMLPLVASGTAEHCIRTLAISYRQNGDPDTAGRILSGMQKVMLSNPTQVDKALWVYHEALFQNVHATHDSLTHFA
jgi:hypothetical protein